MCVGKAGTEDELKATEDGYPLYRSVGFEDDGSKYHIMRWKNRELSGRSN